MPPRSSDHPLTSPRVRLSELPRTGPTRVELILSNDARAAIVKRLELSGLRKETLTGTLSPVGRQDWDFDGMLGATVVQPCVRTLAPVTTRIDEAVTRRFRADEPVAPQDDEMEMPEDDTREPLPETVDVSAIFEEALALALPLYPMAESVPLGDRQFAAPGVTPLTDEDVKPLAGLADLKRKLEGGGGDN